MAWQLHLLKNVAADSNNGCFFGILHHVLEMCSSVAEEYTASIFRVMIWFRWMLK
jgi:hypothetical protein